MRILQINSTLNYGSTGRITEDIGLIVIENNGESYIAYGRTGYKSKSKSIKIGSKKDVVFHLLNTRFFDTHGFHSKNATRKLIEQINLIEPDIIHLHNLHGYYLNIEILFEFLKYYSKPIVWTLHDCWSYTGHCCYYERVKCEKWKTECSNCPLKSIYPQTLLFDNSKRNFKKKRKLFLSVEDNLHLVTVSNWLENQVNQSFLKYKSLKTIYNGIDLNVFKKLDSYVLKEKYGYRSFKVILGVANVWSKGKGLDSFLKISKMLEDDIKIILIGLGKDQTKKLPDNIVAVQRTKNQTELAEYYNLADVFVNPSIAETFGMVTAEAMSCGTPSIVYNSSANPELVTNEVGFVINPNDYQTMVDCINKILKNGKEEYSENCIKRAHLLFDKSKQFNQYFQLYSNLLNK